jgi:hypothetical protein
VVPINSSLLTVTLYSSVITTQNIQSLSWRYNQVRLYLYWETVVWIHLYWIAQIIFTVWPWKFLGFCLRHLTKGNTSVVYTWQSKLLPFSTLFKTWRISTVISNGISVKQLYVIVNEHKYAIQKVVVNFHKRIAFHSRERATSDYVHSNKLKLGTQIS